MFFYVSLLKKYVHDPNHVINWDVIQVEPEGEFQIEPMCILEGYKLEEDGLLTYKCHAIGTSIFVQFCGTLRRC